MLEKIQVLEASQLNRWAKQRAKPAEGE